MGSRHFVALGRRGCTSAALRNGNAIGHPSVGSVQCAHDALEVVGVSSFRIATAPQNGRSLTKKCR